MLIGGGPEPASSRSFIQGRVDNVAFYSYTLSIAQMTARAEVCIAYFEVGKDVEIWRNQKH